MKIINQSLFLILFLVNTSARGEFFENKNFGEIPPPGGPTDLRSNDNPWVKEGKLYEQFIPDLKNATHFVKPSNTVRIKGIGDTFYIEGEILLYVLDLMKEYEISNDIKIKKIVLNSFGGQVEGGIAISEWVRENNIITIVPTNGTCASICTLVFASGIRRIAASYSVLLIHGVRVGETGMLTIYNKALQDFGEEKARELWETWSIQVVESTKKLFNLYEMYGVSTNLEDFYMSLPEDPNFFENGNPLKIIDWRMNGAEALYYGLATELL